MKRLLFVLLALAWANVTLAAPISTYPLATMPLSGNETMISTQAGKTVNITPSQIGSYISPTLSVTGPYTNQLPQTLPPATNYPVLNIFTFLTPANQAKVQAGTATVSDFDTLQIINYAILAFNYNNSTRQILAPCGTYPFSGELDIRVAAQISGEGLGASTGGYPCTIFSFPANSNGIWVHAHDSTTTGTGFGTSIRNVELTSAGGTSGNGLMVRATGTYQNILLNNWPGNALDDQANCCNSTSDPTHGNANAAYFQNITVQGNNLTTNAFYVAGSDVNNQTWINPQAFSVNGWCFYDGSFLGLTVFNLGMAACARNGVVDYNPGSGTVSWYSAPGAISSQLNTTTPGTNSAVWGSYGKDYGFPAWISGGPTGGYTPGGSVWVENANAPSTYYGTYSESGSPPLQMGNEGCNYGGLTGDGVFGCAFQPSQGVTYSRQPLATIHTSGSNAYVSQLGSASDGTLLSSIYNAGAYPWRIYGSSGDVVYAYGSFSNYINGIDTGPGTTQQFSTGVNQPLVSVKTHFMIGDWNFGGGVSFTTARALFTCPSAPSSSVGSFAQGAYCFNQTPSAGGIIGYSATATGTPGTWVTNYLNDRADPVEQGYLTGAGGAVTQATSRTTGVTIAKPSFDITLVSAAGSATPATMTVTDSLVGVSDVPRCVEKSGTDLYQILITAVGAGSFNITFFTTGGTTTEQPVFHCNINSGAISLLTPANDNDPERLAA